MLPDRVSPFVAAVLGPPGRQRLRVSQSLLALIVYSLFACMQHAEVMLGLVDARSSTVLTSVYLSGALFFFAVIRSGVNEGFTADPGLTLPQSVFGIVICAGSYAITGPARGAVMTLLVLVVVFAMFSLRPAQSRALALFAFALLAAVMLWKSRGEPARYPPVIELLHAVFAGVVLASVSVLAGRMGTMRARLKSQKQELQRALEEIGRMATRDELTGLVNRRHMTELLQAEQLRLRRQAAPLTLALIDIDLFKRINDGHGHQAGDTVLMTFAEASRKVLRSNDVLARWGGEEFLLMLPGTRPEQAQRSVDRLRELLAQISFADIDPALIVTFSAGISAWRCDDSLETCIERADQAMYRAKTQGRNCTVMG